MYYFQSDDLLQAGENKKISLDKIKNFQWKIRKQLLPEADISELLNDVNGILLVALDEMGINIFEATLFPLQMMIIEWLFYQHTY